MRKIKKIFSGTGKRCMVARRKAGLTQVQLAGRVGWSTHKPVSFIERGQTLPSLEFVEALAELSGYNVRWLLFGEGAQTRKRDTVMNQWLQLYLNTPEESRADLLAVAVAARRLLKDKARSSIDGDDYAGSGGGDGQ